MPLLNPAPAWNPDRSSHLVLWHGCTGNDRLGIEKHGIELSRSRLALDFGRGFYTTTLERQARHWAWIRYFDPRSNRKNNQPVVLRFNLLREDLAKLQSLSFVRAAYDGLDFWSFVQHCRQSTEPDPNTASPGTVHDHRGPVYEMGYWYDLVSGPAAAFWEQRAAMADADQFSFHTASGIACLNALIHKGMPHYQWKPVT
jgi:hypothetical protein